MKDKNTHKKLSFGQRMKALKESKKKAAKEKELLDQFPSQPSLEAKIEKHLVMPIDVTASTEMRTVVVESQTALERSLDNLREQIRANQGQ